MLNVLFDRNNKLLFLSLLYSASFTIFMLFSTPKGMLETYPVFTI